MSFISLRFIFYPTNADEEISNDNLYQSRRFAARCLEHCGFGEVRQEADSRFSNAFAFPTIDQYQAGALIINYTWELPLRHGNIHTFADIIPHLQAEYNDEHRTTRLDVEIIFTHT